MYILHLQVKIPLWKGGGAQTLSEEDIACPHLNR